ncbi:MAG: type II CRISPR RNA-guided endonuclease Cas9 [Brevinematales bacterium]|nr:type II CRISPR RNA-guided endonuclease Cas9 [Brevinematales bacterium]
MDKKSDYILGLDLGSNSLGWAVIQNDGKKNPKAILGMGVRIFNPGMKDLETSNPVTAASDRRNARQIRRQSDRRRRRKLKVYYLLKNIGLFPSGETREGFIERIDKETVGKYLDQSFDPKQFFHIIPYYLRTRALDHQLSPEELARVLYHLAQRRGFLSNRKELRKQDDYGKVKKGISELHQEIENSGNRTIGEHYSKSNPLEKRIRGRYTGRDMYLDEFETIFEKQRQFYPQLLNEDYKNKLKDALFFQRPLKSSRHLVGMCEYEKTSKRCPWYRIEAQQFRILQTLNNLRIMEEKKPSRKLSYEESDILFKALDKTDRLTLTETKKLLNLPAKGTKINFEEGGETRLLGNKTNHVLSQIFGDEYETFTGVQKEDLLHDINSIQSIERLKALGKTKWGLTAEKAELLSEAVLEEGYCGLSLKALKKILPGMKKGISYPEAVKDIYGEFHQKTTILEQIPMLEKSLQNLTNPLVKRCLTEVRRCVNAVITRYGLPQEIHIELAREMKASKERRAKMIQDNRENEKERKRAEAYLESNGITNPSRETITKYLLAEESHWECPYTGKSISHAALFGPTPEFDIEHIIPLSRSLEDSFANKTLCYNEENRTVKRDQTPYEAYISNPDKYNLIQERVSRFRGKFRDIKLDRFMMADASYFEDFTDRHMNDTRYASKLAMQYLSYLYGGLWDEDGNRKIYCNSGAITAYLRGYYGMNRALGGDKKNRDDHRHHAVDAVAIALTSGRSIKELADYAKHSWIYGKARIPGKAEPWEGFFSELEKKVETIIPIHHISNKVSGKLHADTFYGDTGEEGKVTIRKKLESLSKNEVQKIKDSFIRGKVEQILLQKSEAEPQKIFSDPVNLPVIEGKDGINIPVKSVIIETNLKTFTIGSGDRLRRVANESNHHMEIVAVLDENGQEIKWEGYCVSMFEAYRRKKNHEPVILRDFGEGKKFKFSLHEKTMIELDMNDKRELFVVRSIPESLQIMFVKSLDARKQKDIKEAKEWFSKMPDTLRISNCRKVILTPFGEVRYAND